MNKRRIKRLASSLNNLSEQEILLHQIGYDCVKGYVTSRESLSTRKFAPRILKGVEKALAVLRSEMTLDLSGNELWCHADTDCVTGKIVIEMIGDLDYKRDLLVSIAFHTLDCYASIFIGAHETGVPMPSMYEDILEKLPYHRLTPLNKKRRETLLYIKEEFRYLHPWYVTFSSEEYDEKKITNPEMSDWHADANADKDFLAYWNFARAMHLA
ncbi:MAG: hypothetical protein UR69_C0002G0077 [Candidatus Moranbacteria bacterium GW2011_GWE2_35_2-]|nr:MAG: hypothetical protein UR69_C0002G0077 [Candidatus Moranbacteria bacterium GW2011_GWE2_35_2-]KKQ05012.1 MAG: hypothetical protein US15_C0037G0009 [Candidatus Moranbacteria bacterium GW2011_GWF1_36_4]KKQ22574.1 MAG: hypothetical protein US37_C0002G0199 [Candidatus Moranbacteria bacterium GW2011_GWF2_37_11]KKQ28977.1 MAG: hypothetical protein US44_C0004G0021 [Candidatus Moranbacteria bacterium GW2011_GWD1_37_17]KKQ30487.1 MAG: hypothetical protein US47_C0002G0077 [Candidatus Moranbacteria b